MATFMAWDGVEPRRWLAHYICAEIAGPCDDTCLRIADALLGVATIFPRGSEPSEAMKLAFIKAHTAVEGEWLPSEKWEEALDAGLRAALAVLRET